MEQRLSNMRADVRRFDPDFEQVRIHFEASASGYATLVVFNAEGAWVLSLGEIGIRQGTNTVVWHGHDADGWPLGDGAYHLELFGFARDRRPICEPALRLTVNLFRHPVEGALPGDLLFRRDLWRSYTLSQPAPVASRR
jgi:hypothetical protein